MSKKKVNINELSVAKQTSIAVRALSDKGFENGTIADLLYMTRKQVGATMAWHKNRASWQS